MRNTPINGIDPDGKEPVLTPGVVATSKFTYETSIQECNRKIENPTKDCIIGCANIAGHPFFRWPDGNGGFGSVGFQDPNGKDGDLPQPDHPEEAKACYTCQRLGATLKYGSGQGKDARWASDGEIQDCLKNRPLKGDYGGLLNNCFDWVNGAKKDCGLWCFRDNVLKK